MATFPISSAPWPVGTSVSVYPAEAWVEPSSAPSGAVAATATVSSASTVTFTGLADNRRYVAYALGMGVKFATFAKPAETTDFRLTSVEADVAVVQEAPVTITDARFGAIGDGATNDTTAIAAALTHVAGVTKPRIEVPAGKVFRTTQQTLPTTGVEFMGGGTLKRFDTSTQDLLRAAAAASGVTLKEVTLDGNGTAGNLFTLPNGSNDLRFDKAVFQNYVGAALAISLGTGTLTNKRIKLLNSQFNGDATAVNHDAVILHADHLDVRGCRFIGGALGLTYSSGITEVARSLHIIDNEWEDNIASCILIRPSGAHVIEDEQVIGNRAYHVGIGEPGNAVYKGFITCGENNTTSTLSTTRRIVIAENEVKWFGGAGIVVGGGSGFGRVEDVTIESNIVDGSDSSDNIDTTGTVWGALPGIEAINAAGFSISNNHVRRTPLSGIYVFGAGTDTTQVLRDGTICGNTVEETAVKTDIANIDFYCGIMVFNQAHDILIEGNVSKNTGRQLGTQAGIGTLSGATTAGLSGLTIKGNRCYDDRGTPFQAYGVRVGRSDADANQPSACKLEGNDLRGNATDAYKTFNTTAKGNRFANNDGVVTPTVASAATIALLTEDIVFVSGVTTINTINGGWPGREVVLIFQSTAGVADSVGNVKLSAAFTGTADDTLTLVSDGTSWYEKSRSAN